MSRSGGAPGSPGACIARPPAPSPGKLTLRGGFTVLDRQQCRLDQRARALGFVDLASYLRARCEQDAALPRMASELATTTPVVRRLLTQEGIQRPPQTVMTAKHRRRLTDQRLARQAAQLGFATLEDYLADRVAERAWPLGEVAGELGAHVRTVRERLDRYGLRRQQPTPRQAAGHRRAAKRRQARWQAKRQARLAMLGFAPCRRTWRSAGSSRTGRSGGSAPSSTWTRRG